MELCSSVEFEDARAHLRLTEPFTEELDDEGKRLIDYTIKNCLKKIDDCEGNGLGPEACTKRMKAYEELRHTFMNEKEVVHVEPMDTNFIVTFDDKSQVIRDEAGTCALSGGKEWIDALVKETEVQRLQEYMDWLAPEGHQRAEGAATMTGELICLNRGTPFWGPVETATGLCAKMRTADIQLRWLGPRE